MAEAAHSQVYRRRRPERSVAYRALTHHFERFLQVYDGAVGLVGAVVVTESEGQQMLLPDCAQRRHATVRRVGENGVAVFTVDSKSRRAQVEKDFEGSAYISPRSTKRLLFCCRSRRGRIAP